MVETYREKAIEANGERCEICESTKSIVVHHVDGDRDNNNIDNLLVVCETCHGKIHSPEENGVEWDRYTQQLPVDSLYGVSPKEGQMKRRSITIRQDQVEWVDENSINLSKLVRKQIDKAQKDNTYKTGDYFR